MVCWDTFHEKSNQLCIGPLVMRFLDDADGKVISVILKCPKVKSGTGIIMEESLEYQYDECLFQIEDIIDGPMELVARRNKKWNVVNYDQISDHFNHALNMDRVSLKNYQY